MKIKLLTMIVVALASVCTQDLQAQSPDDLQRQIDALQQQLDAVRGGTPQGVSQRAAATQGSMQGRAVQLRPVETGRSTSLRIGKPGRAVTGGQAAGAAQGTQGAQATSGEPGVQTAQGAQMTQERQLEARLKQLREQQQAARPSEQTYQSGQSGGYYTPPAQGRAVTAGYATSTGGAGGAGSAKNARGARNAGGARSAEQWYAEQGGYAYGGGYAYDGGLAMSGGRRGGRGGSGEYDAIAIKTNLASLAAIAPNLSFEFAIGGKTSLELAFQYNGWGRAPEKLILDPGGSGKIIDPLDGTVYKEKQMDHLLGKAELRLWLMERMRGQFLGFHVLYSKYDVYGIKVPFLFEKDLRYDGTALGFGIGYGYKWEWHQRIGLEASFGLGMMNLGYDKWAWHPNTQGVERGQFKKTYFGPTNIGARIYFMIK